jgi:hypothetical protein
MYVAKNTRIENLNQRLITNLSDCFLSMPPAEIRMGYVRGRKLYTR